MGFVFGVLLFFRLPLQVALGLYFAFMMLMVTAAGIAYFAEGIDYCNEFKFAVGAIAAIVHDVLLTVGFFSISRLEFDLTVLAAILAVIGYSLNDTIVVYDRIRENFRRLKKDDEAGSVINGSLNQTLSRTLVTSGTTLAVVLCLYIFGGEMIRGFSVALAVGILVGTYSSIYVASSALIAMQVSRQDLLSESREEKAPNDNESFIDRK